MANGNRVVVITGASAGLGLAIARGFARQGASVALIARGHAGLSAAAEDVERLGGKALSVTADVSDPDAIDFAADRIERELGPIDIWINNAMTAVLGEVSDTPADEFRRVTEVTYLGQVHGTKAALRVMEPRGRGHIILIGSALAHRGIPLQATYCGAKHATKGFFESLRCELRHRGSKIGLTMVQMPGMNTTQFTWVRLRVPKEPQPVAPFYSPEVGARAVLWAADHPKRREIWVGVPTVYTIVGNRLASWLAEWYLARTAVSGQQTDRAPAADRRDYLEAPVDDQRRRGVDGPFADRALDRSPQTWAATHRGALASVGAAALGAAGLIARRG
jgi:NAD(P)-dependent dehydrogenase (short-subunit alcohol dehydrogenase family)